MNGDHLRQRWQTPELAATARLDARVDVITARLFEHEERVQALTDMLLTAFAAAGRHDLVPQRPRHLRHLRVVEAESADGVT